MSTFPFTMQRQSQPNWCWAAVSTSVSHYYVGNSPWTQCKVADAQLGKTTCCSAPGPCNVYGYLDRALQTVGCYAGMTASAIPYNAVETQMSLKRPLGMRVAWSGGGAHFIAAHGTSIVGNQQMMAVSDSIYGDSLYRYGSLYRGSGTWTHSYYTQH